METTTAQEKILIVDDTLSAIDLLTNTLEAEGYQLFVATSGEKAIKVAKLNTPDLILLDILMPGIDGFETCSRLKADEQTKTIPVIFMTGLSETKDKVKGLSLGAVDFITKPLQIEELLARVSTHLEIQRYRHHLEEEIKERILEKEKAESDSQKMATILDAATIGVWEYDIKHSVLQFDDIMYRLYGVSREEFPNPLDAINLVIHPVDKDKVLPSLLERIQNGESYFNFQLRITPPKEAIRYIQAKITVNRNSEGVPIKVLGAEELIVDNKNNSTSRPKIVALGASAGGVEAINQLFDHMPRNPGLAFVIVTHRPNNLTDTLRNSIIPHTDMPVLVITDGTKPLVNTIYVLPSGKNVVITDGALKLENKIKENIPTDIDKFFISLSISEKQNAVAIILSGMLYDGVAGIKEVKKKGGMTIAQAPQTALCPSMPQSAIDSGDIDFILPISSIPSLLPIEIKRHDPVYQGLLQRLEKLTYTYGKLIKTHDNFKNLISNIDDSILSVILILDDHVRIKAFAGPIERIIPIIDTDIGRPVSDLKSTLRYENLESDTREVLRTATPKEIETFGPDGKKYLVRIALNKYSNDDNVEIIISFIPLINR